MENGLVERARQGDREACEELVRRHQDRVFHYALYLLPTQQDAEDVVQETFLQAYRNLKGFRGEAAFGTWLLAIARARVALWYRRRKLEDRVSELNEPSPVDLEAPTLMKIEIRSAVARLPVAYREVIVLRYVHELDLVEIARAMGISVTAVGVRLHRARRMLRESLSAVRTEEECAHEM